MNAVKTIKYLSQSQISLMTFKFSPLTPELSFLIFKLLPLTLELHAKYRALSFMSFYDMIDEFSIIVFLPRIARANKFMLTAYSCCIHWNRNFLHKARIPLPMII